MCHRAHGSASDVRYRSLNASDFAGDALIVGTASEGDKGLCYSCHGVDAIGSDTDVQSEFGGSSAHVLAPGASAYGPNAKQCSDCHDSHGTDKTASGTPYPELLRVRKSNGTRVFAKEEYCAVCHAARPASRYSGVDVYRRTAHYTAFPDPSSGTGIRCSVCHASHGSEVAPLIKPTLEPPAIDTTTAVIANDRTLCISCHSAAYGTWRGSTRYAASIHGTASAEVTIQAEYAGGAERKVGECQNCHAPMGRPDGRGGTIAKLGEKEGIALCLTCHTVAGPGLDMSSTVYPASALDTAAIVAVYSPDAPTDASGRIQVYSRDTSGSAPYSLEGPRTYAMPGGDAVPGAADAGDIDGDGRAEIVVADPTTSTVTIFEQDTMRGLVSASSQVLSIARTADHIAVGDVLPSDGRQEIVVVNTAAHELYVYQFSAGTLTLMDGPLETGLDPSGIAVGDVAGTASEDIVVTSKTDATLRVFTESAGSIGAATPHSAGSSPVGPSIGATLGSGKHEIVVCDSAVQTSVVVYDGGGNELQRRDVDASSTGVLSASLVADILPGLGASAEASEVVVAFSNDSGPSTIQIFPRTAGGGLGDPMVVTTGIRYATGSLAAGDVDSDGKLELLVGNAGVWSPFGSSSRAPSIQVMNATTDGLTIDTAAMTTLWGGGVEMAGRAPSILVADLGRFGPSRHPSGDVAGAHVSTETAPFARHVECVDCHDVHEAVDTETSAPYLKGVMTGAWGVQVTNIDRSTMSYLGPQAAQYEYEVCFKCHSGWTTLDGRRDVARDFNPYNASVHAVEESSTAASATVGSFTGGWSRDSIMYCTDCHAADSGPKGTHASSNSPLLVRPYRGTAMSEPTMLCYRCHSRDVYYEGTADSGSSRSYFGSGAHSIHVRERGFACASCHEAHGSKDQVRMMRDDVGFSYTDSSVSCTNDCHSAPGGTHSYSRP